MNHSFVLETRTKQFIIGFVISGVVTIAALSIWVWKTSQRKPKEFVKSYEKPFEGNQAPFSDESFMGLLITYLIHITCLLK